MSPAALETHPLATAMYAMLFYAALLAVAAVLLRVPKVARSVTLPSGRYGTLDGVRGVLAIGVLIHHSFTMFVYFTQGRWNWSDSPLLNHLGQTTVAMFFMITGFLFTHKAALRSMQWKRFYLSRLARLFPLYGVVVCALFAMVFVLSEGELHVPVPTLLVQFLQWLAFVCFGRPDVNGLPKTWTLIAGVNWSLAYEAFFYVLAVPALYMAQRLLSERAFLASVVALLGVLVMARQVGSIGGQPLRYATHFVCGIVVAAAYREPVLLNTMRSRATRVLCILALAMLLSQIDGSGSVALLATLFLFAALVGGLSVFGLLRSKPALWLGDISYGIYLLHGMVLWITMNFLHTHGALEVMGLAAWAALVAIAGALVVILASVSYVWMERPVMLLASEAVGGHRAPAPLPVGPV